MWRSLPEIEENENWVSYRFHHSAQNFAYFQLDFQLVDVIGAAVQILEFDQLREISR